MTFSNSSFHIKNLQQECVENFSQVSSAMVYNNFIKNTSTVPHSQNKWVEYYPFLDGVDWKSIYLLASRIVIDTYLITLQFKILHRVLVCNDKLYQWKIKDSPECSMCPQIENLEHYFYYCCDTRYFWDQIENWLSKLFSSSFKFTILNVLLGVINFDTNHYHAINYVILVGKYFICQSKKKERDLFFFNFLHTLKCKLKIDEIVYIQRNRKDLFVKQFSILTNNL